MAGPKQPTNLVVFKGKKHFTKAELEQRRQGELSAPADNIAPPSYLTKKQGQKFVDLACDLLDIGILSNLDCDALARYVQSEEKYLKYDELVNKALRKSGTLEKAADLLVTLEKLEGLRDKALKQCRAAAGDLGLTISSRCRLSVPQKPQAPADDGGAMFGDGDSDTG